MSIIQSAEGQIVWPPQSKKEFCSRWTLDLNCNTGSSWISSLLTHSAYLGLASLHNHLRQFLYIYIHTYVCVSVQFSSIQLLSRVLLFATPWIAARQASLFITNSQSSLRLTSIESVMASRHLILCHALLLLPSIPPRIRVFSNESTLRMKWPKYWSFSLSIIPSKEIPGLISFRMDWLDLLAV